MDRDSNQSLMQIICKWADEYRMPIIDVAIDCLDFYLLFFWFFVLFFFQTSDWIKISQVDPRIWMLF